MRSGFGGRHAATGQGPREVVTRSSLGELFACSADMPIADLDPAELQVIMTDHPNLLMCGPEVSVQSALAFLRPSFRQPVAKWAHDAQQNPPPQQNGTLIIEDATTLDDEQQKSLLQWLDQRAGRVQVIATTLENLFPLARHGLFLNRLFYRLNTLHLDLGCPNWPAREAPEGRVDGPESGNASAASHHPH